MTPGTDSLDRSESPPPPVPSWPRAGVARVLAIALPVGIAYLLAADLSYALTVRSVVIVWIPSGVLLSLLISLETGDWPAALAGACAGNVVIDALRLGGLSADSVLGPVANCIEAVVAALVLRRLIGRRDLLASLRGIQAFVVGAALLSNGLTAVLGGGFLHLWYRMSFAAGWLNWFVGDGLGMIVVTPAMLGLVQGLKRIRRVRPRWPKFLEGAVLLGLVLALAVTVFDRPAGEGAYMASTYLIFAVLIWMALRLGPALPAAAVALLAGATLWFSALGRGPLVDLRQPPLDQAVDMYAFLALASLSVLVPAAAIAERRESADRMRASEARYRALVETARDAIITINAAGNIRFSNPAVEHLFGFKPDALVGRPVLDLLPADQREPVASAFQRFLSGELQVPWHGIQLNVLHRDGREIPVEIAFGDWISEGERCFTGIIRDISERKKLEDDLRHAQQLEALGQLTGGVAHEFRNELTVILANAELAQLDAEPEGAQRSALEEIRAAASRGSALTRELLAFGRRQALQPVVLDLDEVMVRSVSAMGPVLGRQITIEVIGTGAPKLVRADPTALQQALLNLMLNARDAMPAGGRVTLRAGITELDAAFAERLVLPAAGRYVTLDVADSGAGMDAATLARLFEPFYTTKTGGTGLGLSAVYGTVRQSGGAIRAESTIGAGTVFRIYLPEAALLAQERPTVSGAPPNHR